MKNHDKRNARTHRGAVSSGGSAPRPNARPSPRTRPAVFLAILVIISVAPLSAEDTLDLNRYYRFPVSFGAGYDSLTPLVDYPVRYTLYGFSGTVRVPIPAFPILQPTLSVGSIMFATRDTPDEKQWENRLVYGAGGITAAHRFAKAFEISGEALVGAGRSVFPNLPEGPAGMTNVVLQTGARITVNPAFNLAIDVHPHVRYLRSAIPFFRELDGPIFGLGLSAQWRLGQDPDAPTAAIRSIRFSDVKLPRAFAAMQSYYLDNPVGSITITNSDRNPITDLHVSFYQPAFMDSPTACAGVERLDPGESRKIDLLAVFNQEVFRTEGTVPLTGEVIATYRSQGRPVEQRHPIAFDLYDKTALVWDDDRKAAAFVTPSDSALRNYGAFIRRIGADVDRPGVSAALQTAVRTYHALAELGIVYQSDPVLPFSRARGNVEFVDSVCLPRDTLARGAGDCDDLTVLYAALLEAVGIETAFITVPGHIYPAINTKVAESHARSVHPDPAMTLVLDGEVWVPVEITLIGRDSFIEAWRIGSAQYREYDDAPEHREIIVVRDAQSVYRPVGLRESDLGLQYGQADSIRQRFESDMERIAEVVLAHVGRIARERGRVQDFNRLGVEAARYGRTDDARQSFRRAIEIDPTFLEASVNLGTLEQLSGRHDSAVRTLTDALARLETVSANVPPSPRAVALEAGIHSALARSYAALGEPDRSAFHIAQAPSQTQVGEGEQTGIQGRASDALAPNFDSVFFFDPVD